MDQAEDKGAVRVLDDAVGVFFMFMLTYTTVSLGCDELL